LSREATSLKATKVPFTEGSTDELPKLVQAPYRFNGEYPTTTVRAYTTGTPGLVVAKSHKIKHNLLTGVVDIVAVTGSWDIVLYPYGEQILGPFRTKKAAEEVCRKLSPWNWVSFYASDIERNNDMKLLKKAILDIKVEYGV
jgi:hypothetical protein